MRTGSKRPLRLSTSAASRVLGTQALQGPAPRAPNPQSQILAGADGKDGTVYLTNEEAAALLRLSPRTLEGARTTGTGPRFFKLGPGKRARVVYRRLDLLEWVEKYGFGSTAEYTG